MARGYARGVLPGLPEGLGIGIGAGMSEGLAPYCVWFGQERRWQKQRWRSGGAMQKFQYKRPRPKLSTAHEYHQHGSFLTETHKHFLSGKERETEIEACTNQLEHVCKHQFPRTQNLEYAVLKSHLIVEHALVQYIRCFAATAVSADQIRFPFAQKLEVAYLLGFGANDPILIPTVETLNRVRNQVAHSFTLDRSAVDEMLRINSDDYDNFQVPNDRYRIRHLRSICVYISGYVGGRALASFYMLNDRASPPPANAEDLALS